MAHTPPGQTRRRIYQFVRERILAGTPPTIRDVQHAFGFRAVESAREHLQALVAEGLLEKIAGRARGYSLPGGEMTIAVPLLGRVQAGPLTTAIEDPDGFVTVTSHSAADELFALRVHGNSMTGASIMQNDVVIVRRQPTADSGDIVVAMVGDEATVKRLRIVNGRPELHAENPAYAPIVPGSPDELSLLGKVIEVRRYLEDPPPWPN